MDKPRIIEWPFPFSGLSTVMSHRNAREGTSPDLANVRLFDVIEERARGGQRPGLDLSIDLGEPIYWIGEIPKIDSELGIIDSRDLVVATENNIWIGTSAEQLSNTTQFVDYVAPSVFIPFRNKLYVYVISKSSGIVWDGDAGWSDWDSENMPFDVTVGCVYRDRIVLSGGLTNGHRYYASRVGDASDWDYGQTDSAAAFQGGDIGETVTALVPLQDDYLLIGCKTSVYLVKGDPMAGGQIGLVDDKVGIMSNSAWAAMGPGTVLFSNGVDLYTFSVEAGLNDVSSEKVSNVVEHGNKYIDIPEEDAEYEETHHFAVPFMAPVVLYSVRTSSLWEHDKWVLEGEEVAGDSLALHLDEPPSETTEVHFKFVDSVMPAVAVDAEWSEVDKGVYLIIQYEQGCGGIFLDLRSEGIFPDYYDANINPVVSHFFDSEKSYHRGMYIGSADGKIFRFNDKSYSDNGYDIDSYITFLPRRIGGSEFIKGIVRKLWLVMDENSGPADWTLRVGDTFQNVVESKNKVSGSTSKGGRQQVARKRIRGSVVTLTLGNSETDKAWALESVVAEGRPSGRQK